MSSERFGRKGKQNHNRTPRFSFYSENFWEEETKSKGPPSPLEGLSLEIPPIGDAGFSETAGNYGEDDNLSWARERFFGTRSGLSEKGRWAIILSLVFACSLTSSYVYYSSLDAHERSSSTIIFDREGENLGWQEKILDSFIPRGSPLGDAKGVVITQGYGVGTHAPAEVWGGLDLAIDSNGDGKAEPDSTWKVPVYATHNGTVELKANTWPGGNCVIVQNEEYRTLYCHLDSFAPDLENGQSVRRGELLGYVGSTGQSSGPHLHYETWQSGVNQDPSNFQVLELMSNYQRLPPDMTQELQAEEALSIRLDPYSNLDQKQTHAEIYSAYNYVAGRMGKGAGNRIEVIFSGNQGCNLEGFADTVGRRVVVYSCDRIPFERALAILAHELGHQLAHDYHGQSHLNADHMLLEGFATWLAGKYWLGSGFEDFRSYVRKNYGGNPDRLGSFFIAHSYGRPYKEMNELYDKWASFCEFLIEKYGMALFDQLYRSGQKTSGSADYEGIYRKTLDELILEWKEWILEK